MRRLVLGVLLVALSAAACSAADDDEENRPVPEPVPNQLQEEKIVFARRPALGDDSELYVVNPDGTGLRRLTHDGPREAEDLAPAWSPDGRMIAFVSDRTRRPDEPTVDRPPAEEIYVMRADGTGQRRLTRNTRLDLAPQWLPDGRIAFISCATTPRDEPPECELSTIRIGSAEREGLAELGFAFEAEVSPDGARVVYSRLEGQSHFQHFELHVTDVGGGDDRQLTDNEAGDGSPAWSPDGDEIAFVSNRAESARCFSHDCAGFTNELYFMDADGTDVARLTETPHEEASPTWSPDGTRILYSRQLDGNATRELWVVNADGSCPTRLLHGAWDTMPDWYGPAAAESQRLDC